MSRANLPFKNKNKDKNISTVGLSTPSESLSTVQSKMNSHTANIQKKKFNKNLWVITLRLSNTKQKNARYSCSIRYKIFHLPCVTTRDVKFRELLTNSVQGEHKAVKHLFQIKFFLFPLFGVLFFSRILITCYQRN